MSSSTRSARSRGEDAPAGVAALLTRMSTPPSSSATCAIAVRTALSSVVSADSDSTRPPRSRSRTAAAIAEALLDYVAIGVSTLLIRGYDPVGDATNYARLIKLVRDQEPALASRALVGVAP